MHVMVTAHRQILKQKIPMSMVTNKPGILRRESIAHVDGELPTVTATTLSSVTLCLR